jgi:hypothetical protein
MNEQMKEEVSVDTDSAMNILYEGDVHTQMSVDRNQVHPSKLAEWYEIEDVKRDMAELNQILKTPKRQTVIEVILSEVNILSVKVASLCEVIEMQTVNDTKWSEVKYSIKYSIKY